MSSGDSVIIIFSLVLTAVTSETPEFRFSNIYGDHMVLQQAPHQANVWGYTTDCLDTITVNFVQENYPTILIKDNSSGKCKWRVTLPPTPGSSQESYTITATSQKHGSIKISDVLFGDVWVCGGQSNMQFTVSQVYNATDEISKAAIYPHIRLFTAALVSSLVPLDELAQVEQQWSVAGPDSVNGSDWSYFSATCWFFGRDLYKTRNYPIGLIDTDWGGTPIEAWSSVDALSQCNKQEDVNISKDNDAWKTFHRNAKNVNETLARPNPSTPTVLWNAMIYPFLNMTIKGAIWYQGESNAGNPGNYHCNFPAMIDDWRQKWNMFTMQQTDPLFGFGFVQLAPTGNSNDTIGGFPDIRWAQTANYGYVPNDRLNNVFMAVAIDLGDPTSPYGSIHPRDKQDVGSRLALSARAVVYNDQLVINDFQGPIAQSALMSETNGSIQVIVHYKGDNSVILRYPYGFELGCGNTKNGVSQWIEGTAHNGTGFAQQVANVSFPLCPSQLSPVSIRYCWRTDPCTFKMCPIYSSYWDLPSPPFIMDLQI